MTTPVGNVCPPTAFTRYAPPITFTVNTESYSGLLGSPAPLVVNFSWASRTTDPEFQDSYSGVLKQEPTESTLRYLGRNYSLVSIQFTPASHQGWVIPATAQSANKEDVVLTFRTNDTITDTNPNTIVLVSPLIRNDAATPPAYMVALSKQDGTAGTISPRNLVSAAGDGLYAYYTVCAQGYASGEAAQYVQVIVFPRGIEVPSSLMTAIYGKMGSAQTSPSFGTYQPPLGLVLAASTSVTMDETKFQQIVKFGYQLGGSATPAETTPVVPATPAPPPDSTNAYKCVSLNPETDISGGKLFIDPTTGIPLSQVEQGRQEVITAAKPTLSLTKYTESIKQPLSILLAIAFVFVLFYIIFSASGQIGVPGEDMGAAKSLWLKFIDYGMLPITIGIIAGFIGFIVGLVMK